MNYINDILFSEEDGIFNCVVEMTNGDNVEYAIEPKGRYLEAVRALDPVFVCPFTFGFIPQTISTDLKPTKVVVITPAPLQKLSVVKIRPLGTITVVRGSDEADMIISVPAYSSLKRISVGKVTSFFKNAYYSDVKDVKVKDYFPDPSFARQIIEEDHQEYLDSLRGEAAESYEEDYASAFYSPVQVAQTEGTPIASTTTEETPAVKEEEQKEVASPQEPEIPAVEETTGVEQAPVEDIENEWLS